jgi:hypothetical protein
VSDTDFYKKLNKARREARRAKSIRSEYYQDLNEGLAEDLWGIAKDLAGPVASAAKSLGAAFKGLFKGILELIVTPFKEAAWAALGSMIIDKALFDDAANAGLPECVFAVPCPFWILSNKQNKLQTSDAKVIIGKFGDGIPSDMADIIENLGESLDIDDMNLLFKRWSRSLLNEALKDFKDKAPQPWVVELGSSVPRYTELSKAKDFSEVGYSDIEWSHFLVSSKMKYDGSENDENLLKVAYTEVDGEGADTYKASLKDGIETRSKNLVALHFLIAARRGKSDRALASEYGVNGVILSKSYKKDYLLARDLYTEWERSDDFKDAGTDSDALLASIKTFMSEKSGKSGETEGEPGEEKIDLNETDREKIARVLASPEWYEAVYNNHTKNNAAQVEQLLKSQFMAPLGVEFAKIQEAKTIGDINGNPEFKTMFEKFWQTPDMAEIKDIYDFALENNNDEIMSRLIAAFRPVLAKGFVDYIKDEEMLKDVSGKLGQLVSQAEAVDPHGYDRTKDPSFQAYIDLKEKFTEELIDVYEKGAAELEKIGEKALSEVIPIYEKAQEDGAPAADVDPDAGSGAADE